MPAVGRLCEPGRTLFSDFKYIISLDLLPKLFKCPHVIAHDCTFNKGRLQFFWLLLWRFKWKVKSAIKYIFYFRNMCVRPYMRI